MNTSQIFTSSLWVGNAIHNVLLYLHKLNHEKLKFRQNLFEKGLKREGKAVGGKQKHLYSGHCPNRLWLASGSKLG